MKTTPPLSIRTVLPRILNLLLWLIFCAISGTGLLLAFRLPPGSRGGRGLSAWGLDRHEWGDIHLWIGYALLALIVVHLALHWRWFWAVASRKRAWPMIAGFGLGLALMAALFFSPVRRDGKHRSENAAIAPAVKFAATSLITPQQ